MDERTNRHMPSLHEKPGRNKPMMTSSNKNEVKILVKIIKCNMLKLSGVNV